MKTVSSTHNVTYSRKRQMVTADEGSIRSRAIEKRETRFRRQRLILIKTERPLWMRKIDGVVHHNVRCQKQLIIARMQKQRHVAGSMSGGVYGR